MQHKQEAIIRRFINLPWFFIILIIAISSLGFMALYSAAKGNIDPWAHKQMVRFAIGFAMMIVIAIIDIRLWFKLAYLSYAFGIVLLLLVDIVGTRGMGAQRWLNLGGFYFQPSELMKAFLVLTLARYYHMIHWGNIQRFFSLAVPLVLIAIAAILVLRQPNLGTATIIVVMSAGILFMAGVSWKKFALAGIIVVALAPFAWNHMHDYQKRRVYTFLNPESDPLGAGYNIIQSKIAIGSGGWAGKGFLNGTQSQLSFVPEKQTDFIFAIIAEEFGFLGCLFTIGLYVMLIFSGMKIAMGCKNNFGKLTSYGITLIMFLHVFINIGMVTGILPVVGVPLPLLSYGGSSMISTLIGIGFILNAYVYRNSEISTVS